jgi:hypothetical protein
VINLKEKMKTLKIKQVIRRMKDNLQYLRNLLVISLESNQELRVGFIYNDSILYFLLLSCITGLKNELIVCDINICNEKGMATVIKSERGRGSSVRCVRKRFEKKKEIKDTEESKDKINPS